MRVVLIGATGMIGQGVLLSCLRAPDVTEIIILARRPLPRYDDPRLKVIITPDLAQFAVTDQALTNFDACFFCAGVPSLGMSEPDYRKVTYDLTIHVAEQLLNPNPQMTMIYVSGAGADSSETSRTMWARVRGQTENALQRMKFKRVAIFRPSMIIPEDGIQSRTAAYRWMYTGLRPVLTLLRRLWPNSVLTTSVIGEAMLNTVRHGSPHAVLNAADINRLASGDISNGKPH